MASIQASTGVSPLNPQTSAVASKPPMDIENLLKSLIEMLQKMVAESKNKAGSPSKNANHYSGADSSTASPTSSPTATKSGNSPASSATAPDTVPSETSSPTATNPMASLESSPAENNNTESPVASRAANSQRSRKLAISPANSGDGYGRGLAGTAAAAEGQGSATSTGAVGGGNATSGLQAPVQSGVSAASGSKAATLNDFFGKTPVQFGSITNLGDAAGYADKTPKGMGLVLDQIPWGTMSKDKQASIANAYEGGNAISTRAPLENYADLDQYNGSPAAGKLNMKAQYIAMADKDMDNQFTPERIDLFKKDAANMWDKHGTVEGALFQLNNRSLIDKWSKDPEQFRPQMKELAQSGAFVSSDLSAKLALEDKDYMQAQKNFVDMAHEEGMKATMYVSATDGNDPNAQQNITRVVDQMMSQGWAPDAVTSGSYTPGGVGQDLESTLATGTAVLDLYKKHGLYAE